ncbi:MAG: type IV toxin-antitoxin system AbiEi family antitoxin domain-containing protein [Solirubrobacteraceae bacterium]
MGHQILQPSSAALWALAESQHGVVARSQLLDLGLSPEAIKHRMAKGRLHPVWRGVYALGRPQLSRHGTWMAAVLSCGPEASLSHRSAATLWRICQERGGEVEITLPARVARRRPGIVVHRGSRLLPADLTRYHGIPVTSPVRTLIDLAACLPRDQLEAAVNEADKHDLTDPDKLRSALGRYSGQSGATALREALDRRTFTLTESELERRFLPVARKAGLPPPRTRV